MILKPLKVKKLLILVSLYWILLAKCKFLVPKHRTNTISFFFLQENTYEIYNSDFIVAKLNNTKK